MSQSSLPHSEAHCPRCGTAIPAGQEKCPVCASEGTVFSRETVLLLSLAVLFVLFLVTGFASRSFHARRDALAVQWFARGEQNLKNKLPAEAIEDFRTALVYAPDSELYRLRLAQALIAAAEFDQARSYLQSLWTRTPGDGMVNLELARLAARAPDIPEALRYFHNAIYGVWEQNAVEQRRSARMEMCEFLVHAGQREEAQSELAALVSDLPQDPALRVRVASLMEQAGDYDGAVAQFRAVLKLKPGDEQALAGAGRSAFAQGDFRTARFYLQQVVRKNQQASDAASLLDKAELVLGLDPFDARFTIAERARRAVRAFGLAQTRLGGCAAPTGGEDPFATLRERAATLKPDVTEAKLRRDSDRIVEVMEFVFDVEQRAAQTCGAPSDADAALIVLAGKYRQTP